MTQLVQTNDLTHQTEPVVTPEVRNMSQKQWAEKMNENAPSHIKYSVQEQK